MTTRLPDRFAAPIGIGLVVLATLWVVSPTNFGGYDEWLIVQLTRAGRVSMPYAERPLELVWDLPAALLFPNRLAAFLWLHGLYLWLTGILAWRLVRIAVPEQRLTAFVTGTLAATWAPLDFLRLNAIETVAYSGATCATLAAVSLLHEAWRRRSVAVLAAGAVLALAAARTYESVLPLLAAGPALLWLDAIAPEHRRRRSLFAAAWETVVLIGGLLSVSGVVLPAEGSYQMSALHLDLRPLGVLRRLLDQAGFHLLPALTPSWAELATTHVMVATAFFLAAAAVIASHDGASTPRAHARTVLAGAVLAILGWSVFALSPAIRTAARTQFLSAPGVGLFLAALMALIASALPPPARRPTVAALAAWIVAVGAARTGAMQQDWDGQGYWAAQSASLRAITAAVPDVRPNTLVVLLDPARAWPATFTFRHALVMTYEGRAIGLVPGAHDFLYPARFVDGGVSCEPWPVIRDPWSAPPTFHRGDEIIALAARPDGSMAVLEAWPSVLPAASGAGYAPRARIVPARADIAARRIVDSGR